MELKKKLDEIEEERIRKEVEEEKRRLEIEKEMENKKKEDAMKENQRIIEGKRVRIAEPTPKPKKPESPRQPDYSMYEQASKNYSQGSFAPGQAPPEYQPPGPVNQQRRYENDVFAAAGEPAQKHHRLPNYPMRNFDVIHKEDLIKELQLMLKRNLEVEAEKLKEEFQYNQSEFTDQLEKLKKETDRAILQRNAARKELGRLKDEIDYKREYDDNYEKQLMIALTRYNPKNIYKQPADDPNTIGMVAPFRGGAIQRTRLDTPTKRESVERMFFQDIGKGAREIKSHRGEPRSETAQELIGGPSKYLDYKREQ
jgi:hypothetical protein